MTSPYDDPYLAGIEDDLLQCDDNDEELVDYELSDEEGYGRHAAEEQAAGDAADVGMAEALPAADGEHAAVSAAPAAEPAAAATDPAPAAPAVVPAAPAAIPKAGAGSSNSKRNKRPREPERDEREGARDRREVARRRREAERLAAAAARREREQQYNIRRGSESNACQRCFRSSCRGKRDRVTCDATPAECCCSLCGKMGHTAGRCLVPHRLYCRRCHRPGHAEVVCRSQGRYRDSGRGGDRYPAGHEGGEHGDNYRRDAGYGGSGSRDSYDRREPSSRTVQYTPHDTTYPSGTRGPVAAEQAAAPAPAVQAAAPLPAWLAPAEGAVTALIMRAFQGLEANPTLMAQALLSPQPAQQQAPQQMLWQLPQQVQPSRKETW